MVAQIDLSATSIMAMSCVVGASMMTSQGGYLAGQASAPIVAILAIVAIGLAIGLLNGVCTIVFDIPSFLVTLTTMMFFSGAAIWYTAVHTSSGSSIGALPPSFLAIGYGGLAGIPYAAVITAALAIIVHLVLTRTVFGRWVRAVGLNPNAAAISGVPVKRVVIGCFALSGLFAAFAATIYTARLEAGTPILGQRILLDVIGAAVIGGVSLFGGKGSVIGVLIGVLFLSTVDNGLQLLGLSLSSVYAIKGGVILLAAVVTRSATTCWRGARRCPTSFEGHRPQQELLRRQGAARRRTRVAPRNRARAGRRERLGKVDDDEYPGRRPGERQRPGGARRRRGSASEFGRGARAWHRLHPSGAQPLPQPQRRGEHFSRPFPAQGVRASVHSTGAGSGTRRARPLSSSISKCFQSRP